MPCGRAGTRLTCWYTNLEEPLRRILIRFDTMDDLLDIVVSPDRSEWHWKHENEFAEAVALGVYAEEAAHAIRAEGERAVQRLQKGDPPFASAWGSWKPPKGWGIPAMPVGWDRLEGETPQVVSA